MSLTTYPLFLKRPKKTLNKINPGRLKLPHFFSKTNRIVFLLAFLVVLLSGCPGGVTPPDPTAVGSDGSSEEPQAFPFLLHDFDLFVLYSSVVSGGIPGLINAGSELGSYADINSPDHAVLGIKNGSAVYDRPCSSGSATFTPLGGSATNFHYIADKCYYSEEDTGPWKGVDSGFFDGVYKSTFSGDADNSESFDEFDRFFGIRDVDSASDRKIPPQDFRPLLSGAMHDTRAEDETGSTSTTTIDEMTVHGHGSLRNFSSVVKRNSEGLLSYAMNYDITQTVRDPVVVEGFYHQLELFGFLMQGSGVSLENPKVTDLKNGTYELQVRTPETVTSIDKSIVSGTYTLNLVSHNISAEVRHFEGGYEVTYTNNGETQTETVQH
jgi:hypothetical protein